MGWSGANDITPRVIVAFAAPGSVATVTPLYALNDLGNAYQDLVFTLRNHDAALNAALYIDTSVSGIVVDGQPSQVVVPPLKEWSIIYRDVVTLFFAVSASGDPNAGFSAVNVSFQIAGRLRFAMNSVRRNQTGLQR